MKELVFFLAQLLGYPVVLVGAIVILGKFSRYTRSQTVCEPAARPCTASVLLGLASVAFFWLLARTWTPSPDHLFDYLSGAAWLASIVCGVVELYQRWPAISRWVSYQTLVLRNCRCDKGCTKLPGCSEDSCRCKNGCCCH